jgi:hypothetical protein
LNVLGWFMKFRAIAIWAVSVWPLSCGGGEVDDQRAGEQLYLTKVRPLLAAKCLACHGGDPQKIESGLDLRTRESALRGGESGEPAIVPGSPAESRLLKAVRWDGLEMPPKENDRLKPKEIALLHEWIAIGAPWSEESPGSTPSDSHDDWLRGDGVTVHTSGGLTPEWTNRRYKRADIWAYQPVKKPVVPEAAIDAACVNNPIDAFVQQRLAQAGVVSVAEPADRRTFIRRATFDLLGLPPTHEDVEAFVADTAPDATARLIDRLLADPRYGEQQTRHWLDVVRYADTSGFSNDIERPNAWRYRDYVVRSFNADKPYDRFITEQLAGDELDPLDPEMRIAVGYLRMGPWEHTEMTVAAVTRQQYLDDVTHHVGVSLLGQGMRCASCHDHKFDPIPTRDYYRLQAVFAPVQFAEVPTPFLATENVAHAKEARRRVERRMAQLEPLRAELQNKSAAAKAKYLREHGVSRVEELPAEDRPPGGNFGQEFGLSKTDASLRKIYEKSFQYLQRERERFRPDALTVYDGADNGYKSLRPVRTVTDIAGGMAATVHILAGGSLESPLDAVGPGVLSALVAGEGAPLPREEAAVPDTLADRRLALAEWITSPSNTFTTRVMVNRVWQQHFGKGIVATPNNFGVMGARPSHPELLDWLARWFVEHDWSIKELHRLVMNSATYQQSGERPDRERIRESDAANALLAFFPARRLAAEEIRDGMLAASGDLNPEMGGPGVFPEMNWEVALQPRHIMGSIAPAYVPSRTPRERNRRTLYVFRYRTLADPLLEVFNRPGSDISCECRDQTTVTPQVFALFNSAFVHARSLALAAKLTGENPSIEERIDAAFRRVYGRSAEVSEIEACRAHYEKMLTYHCAREPKPVAMPKVVERGMIEEFTGEMVWWQEELPLDDYVRDTMPSDVGAEVRALAEVCLVLFNSNEFLYVR